MELIAQWNEVVQQSMEVSTVLPPSTVPRGRPMQEGIIFLIGGATTIWCHYYVCGLTPDGYVPTSIMAISWRSMAAPIGPWSTGLSGWIPALSLSITIYIL